MSKSEVERFARDLTTKPALLAEIVAVATHHGYGITVEDAKSLSDSQLDTLAGGRGMMQVLGAKKGGPEVLTDVALESVAAGESLQKGYADAERMAAQELAKMSGGKQ